MSTPASLAADPIDPARAANNAVWLSTHDMQESFYRAAKPKGDRLMEMVRDMDVIEGLDLLEINALEDPDIVMYHVLPHIESVLTEHAQDDHVAKPVNKCYEMLGSLANTYPRYWFQILDMVETHKDDANLTGPDRAHLDECAGAIADWIHGYQEDGVLPFPDPDLLIVDDTPGYTFTPLNDAK